MKEALQLTQEILHRRSRGYRNLVVCISVIIVLMPAVALALFSWKPLLGLILLPVACGLFLLVDGRAVRRWREKILALHRDGELDLAVFRQGMATIRYLPRRSLQAMLETLPEPPKGASNESTRR